MIVIVCGGRDYWNLSAVAAELDALYVEAVDPLRIVEGGAPGADTLARRWARRRITEGWAVELRTHEAMWDLYGRSAGPRRNKHMLEVEKPSLVLAFPGGSGTASMVKLARAAGVEVREVV